MNTTLTIAEIIAVYSALSAIVSVKDDGLRYNVAKNKRILKNEMDIYDEQRIEIIKELSPTHNDMAKESPLLQGKFQSRIAELQKKKLELPGLLKFSEKQGISLTENPNVLEALIPLISE